MTDTARADALLADLPADGARPPESLSRRGAGVGKTFAMLQAAQAQLRQGVKLRAGVVETHSRAETESSSQACRSSRCAASSIEG